MTIQDKVEILFANITALIGTIMLPLDLDLLYKIILILVLISTGVFNIFKIKEIRSKNATKKSDIDNTRKQDET
jgi:hypothetical protein